jgi:hypothetical protein
LRVKTSFEDEDDDEDENDFFANQPHADTTARRYAQSAAIDAPDTQLNFFN